MSQLYPEIRDKSTLTGTFNQPQFLGIGIEGQALGTGTVAVGTPKTVTSSQDADTFFGAGSPLANLVKFVLKLGINSVRAVASIKDDDPPDLAARQDAWEVLEEDADVRIRLTDSAVQANLVALAESCENAEGIQNKQFCVVGLGTPSSSASAVTASTAIGSKRAVLITPGTFDSDGALENGVFAAARVAAMVATNPDITDDLDTVLIPGTTGIETATNGMPLYRLHAGGGDPVNDFETLLQAGASPLRQGKSGKAEITHLRTTYTTDDTMDALMTLLIKDGVFLGIRSELESQQFLRKGNTEDNRALAAEIVNQWLIEHGTWVLPKELPDSSIGYGVTALATSDLRGIVISWNAEIVRNTQTIDLSGNYTIPV